MANPFDVQPVNTLQALLMQGHGADQAFQGQIRPLQLQELRSKIQGRDQLSQMLAGGGATPDYGRLAIAALASGDPTTAGVLANIGNQNASRGIQERQIQLQERQAEEKPQYQIVEDAAGNKQIVKLEPYGRGASVVNPTGMGNAPTNPYSTGGKVNEAQSKDQLYANRMFAAEKALRETESEGTSAVQRGLSKVPIVGNYMVSERMQLLDQAKRDFVNAVLRRESGAAISAGEFDNAEKQYFPQPGDSADTIAQKRRNRAEAIKGVAGGGGPSYRPPATFDESGALIPNTPSGAPSAAPQQAAPALRQSPAAPSDIRSQAMDAIRRGADPRAVAKRLLENNINPDEFGLSWGGD